MVNSHKNFQEIEITDKNNRSNKIILSTCVDFNGRRVLSFNSAYKIINKRLKNLSVEINLIKKYDNNFKSIHNYPIPHENILQSFTILPLTEIYIPFQFSDFISSNVKAILQI